MAYSGKAIPLLETIVALVSIACAWFTFRSKYWPYVFALIFIRAVSAVFAKQNRPSSNAVHVYKVVKPLSTSLVSAFLIFATFLTVPDVRIASFQEQVFVLNLSFSLALFSYFRRKKELLRMVMFPAGMIVAGTCVVALTVHKRDDDTRRAAVGILIGTVLWLSSFFVKSIAGRSMGRIVKRIMLVFACVCFVSPLFDD